ncbi:hypothetical protein [Leptospira noguchii]|uniref:hypothetical protein n=1 Tax=Leptospira noguchii TaxID=28182 RepID=UPI0003287828|nr:hypothetical protein [Leptospira noguchii]EMS84097.1 hypothetical protein LEP1GSC073_2744 [Leptospira noguchii str. Cascata]
MSLIKAIKTLPDGKEIQLLIEESDTSFFEKRGDVEILEPVEEDSSNSKKAKKVSAKTKSESVEEDSKPEDTQGTEGQ